MIYSKSLYKSAPVVEQLVIGEAIPDPGVPLEICATGTGGVALVETTTALNVVGLTPDSQPTMTTAQQTDNSDPEQTVSVLTDPDIVYEAQMSGGSGSGTALTQYTVGTASTTGLIVVDSVPTDFTTFDEGTVYFITGDNAGIGRRIIVGDAVDMNLAVAFPNDIAVGDKFYVLPYGPPAVQYVQLTTDLTEVDVSAGVDTDNANFLVKDLVLYPTGAGGNLENRVRMVAADHYLRNV